jgi:NADH dehydrogenase
VEDIARCLVAANESEETVGATIEVGGPEHLTYNEILDLIARTLGARIVKLHLPVNLVRPVAAIMEALAPWPPVTREQLKMLDLDSCTETDSVAKAFGFAPRPLRGNLDYIRRIGLIAALKMNLGFMPAHIRDH